MDYCKGLVVQSTGAAVDCTLQFSLALVCPSIHPSSAVFSHGHIYIYSFTFCCSLEIKNSD